MEETLVIRNADLDDINTIGYLAHEIWPVAYGQIISDAQLQYMLQWMYSPQSLLQQMRDGHQFFIAEQALEPLGFAALSQVDPQTTKLQKLYVLPSQQGKGIGRALLDVVREEAKARGSRHLILQVNRQNPAFHFYQTYGFYVIGEEDFDIGNGFFMNDYVMQLDL